jgi:hypothetical protein
VTTYALDELRSRFHASLCRRALGYRETRPDVPNIADDSSRVSVAIARSLLEQIPFDPCPTPPTAQGAGSAFAECAREFLDAALEALSAVRPWDYELSTSQKKIGIGAYAQYAHLAELRTLIADNQALRAWLGTDYMVTPDLVVVRLPLRDAALNAARSVVARGAQGVCLRRDTRRPMQKRSCSMPVSRASGGSGATGLRIAASRPSTY